MYKYDPWCPGPPAAQSPKSAFVQNQLALTLFPRTGWGWARGCRAAGCKIQFSPHLISGAAAAAATADWSAAPPRAGPALPLVGAARVLELAGGGGEAQWPGCSDNEDIVILRL